MDYTTNITDGFREVYTIHDTKNAVHNRRRDLALPLAIITAVKTKATAKGTVIKMKKVIIQILKALAYFAVYFIPLNLIVYASQFIYGYFEARKYGMAGVPYEEAMAAIQEGTGTATVIGLLITSVLVLLTYFIIEKVKKTSLAKETDIKKVSPKQIVLTIIGAVGGMFFLNLIMSLLPIPEAMLNNLDNGMANVTSSSLILGLITNSFLVPVMEEVVFRGYLFTRLNKAMPSIVAALISSVLFGFCHGQLLWAAWAFVVGMIICIVRIKSGSIIPGMIFHIIMNTFATVSGYTSILEKLSEPAGIALTVIGGILLVVYIAGILTDKQAPKAQVTVSSAIN